MSDQKKDQQDDIVASEENEPEVIGDQALEDVEGGWVTLQSLKTSFKMNAKIPGGDQFSIPGGDQFDAGKNADTIYAGSAEDVFLRTRPGRFGNPYGG